MLKLVAVVQDLQHCPLYEKGDAIEFHGPRVAGVSGAPVCSIAVQNLAKPLRAVREGESPDPGSALFCGGCDSGRAWFTLVKTETQVKEPPAVPPSPAALASLESMKMFVGVPREPLERIVPLLAERKVADGEIVIAKGDAASALYIIAHGTFEVFAPEEHGSPHLLATLGVGDCFGEMSLISGDPATATVRSRGPGTLFVLTQAEFEKILGMIPSVALNLARILAQRLARASNAIVEELRRGMIGRLDHISPPDLVQAMNVSAMTGMLVVQNDGRSMGIYFQDGQVHQVDFGAEQDEEAFYEFLTWAKGTFRFEPVRKPENVRRVVHDTTGLLLEGMRRLDETKVYRKPGE